MFHMFLLIVFLLIKIQGFKHTIDLDIEFDYTQPVMEELQPDKTILSPAEQAYLDRLLAQASNVSNRAGNISEKLEKEISTDNFVDEYLRELDEQRSEEWLRQQEEIKNRLNQPDYVPPVFEESAEVEMDDYSGPSNISYEFLEAPFNRYKVYLPVPVYKCQGEGTVYVTVNVDQAGKLVSADPSLKQDYPDKDCLLEVARNYALRTRFEVSINSPKYQKARIIYNFIPQ